MQRPGSRSPNDAEVNVDVAIVGGGAAGLMAARTLGRAGRSVVLLEARHRLGGRIHSIVDPRSPVAIELGPEFVHGTPRITAALLAEYGAATFARAGTAFELDANGTLVAAQDDPFERAAAVLRRGKNAAANETVAALLARETTPAGRRDAAVAARLVGGFDAADPARASAREIAEEWASDAATGEQSRPAGGYGPLVAHLARTLDRERVRLHLGAVVDAIAWSVGGVEVNARLRGATHVFRAKRAIVTVPAGVLQAANESGAIVFEPALPPSVANALAHVAMGPVLKVILRFRTRFWERVAEGRFADGAFFSSAGAFPTVWTQLPQRAPLLTAWAGGPAAAALAHFDRDALAALALDGAGALFGTEAAADECEAAYVYDWQRDPFARGAYSYVLAGGDGARRELGAPLARSALVIAGEATAPGGEGGTVAGALQSGERAANSVLGG